MKDSLNKDLLSIGPAYLLVLFNILKCHITLANAAARCNPAGLLTPVLQFMQILQAKPIAKTEKKIYRPKQEFNF